MNAPCTQVGGDHYSRLAIQPMDFAEDYGLSFAEGSVLKYLTRHKQDPTQDRAKALSILRYLHLRYGSPGIFRALLRSFSPLAAAMRHYCRINAIDSVYSEALAHMSLQEYGEAAHILETK